MFSKSTIVTLAVLSHLVHAEDLLIFEKTAPTVYYDNLWRENGDPCKSIWPTGGSDGELGVSLCETNFANPRKMSEYKSNQIVAIDRRYFEGVDAQGRENRKTFCGKQVKVYRPDGTEYISEGGDLFVWDGCYECKRLNGHKVDFSAPDYLAMTGLEAGQCGVGAAEFRVVVTDKQVVEPGDKPPDAPGGLKTFPSKDTGKFNFNAPATQLGYFDSIRLNETPLVTSYGWLGRTPAGTDNLFGLGPGSGTKGYADSGEHPEIIGGAKAPEEWTKAQLAVFGGGYDSGGTSGGGSSVGGSQAGPQPTGDSTGPIAPTGGPGTSTDLTSPPVNVNPAADKVAIPSAPSDTAAGAGATDLTQPPAVVNLAADKVVAPSAPSGTGGVQPAATGVASITAGNCSEGKYRCSGKTVQICSHKSSTIDWQDGPTCPNECVEKGPGYVGCA